MSKPHLHQEAAKSTLREAGFRATTARIAVLQLLDRATRPLGIKEIASKLAKEAQIGTPDQATLYRMLHDFVNKGLVHSLDLRHGYACYEIAARDHHHHIVCEECGVISDIDCKLAKIEKESLKNSGFATINQHSLEFFGVCNDCVRL